MKLLLGLGSQEKFVITPIKILQTAIVLMLAFFAVVGGLLFSAAKIIEYI